MKTTGTWSSTDVRRREILNAALRCFSDYGFAATTMSDIRKVSGASTGSIYHHFESKEKLAAALFVEGLKDYQHSLLHELRRCRTAERIVRGIVLHYLGWVETNVDWARYLLAMGHALLLESAQSEIDQINAAFSDQLQAQLQPHVDGKRIRGYTRPVFLSLLLGPSRDFARRWTDGVSPAAMREAKRILPKAAWSALRAD